MTERTRNLAALLWLLNVGVAWAITAALMIVPLMLWFSKG